MAGIKIVDLPALGRDLAATDLLELSLAGGTGSRKITGQEIINASKLNVGTTPIINGTAGRLLFQSTGNVLSQSGNLFWDNTNGRLGIGTSTPLSALGIVQTDAIITVRNTNATAYSGMNMYDDANNLVGSFAIGGTNASVPALAGNMLIGARTATGRLLIVGGPSATTFATMFSTGNLAINTTTDAGFKFDVNGTARIVNALTLGNVVLSLSSQGNGTISSANSVGNPTTYITLSGPVYYNPTSGTAGTFAVAGQSFMSSGTAQFNTLTVAPIINNSGTYSGIFRGFYYNPTSTSVTGTTHRAIDLTSGDFVWGSGYSQYYGNSVEGFIQFTTSGTTSQLWMRPSGNQNNYNSNYWSRLENNNGAFNIYGSNYGQLLIASSAGGGNGAKIFFSGSTGVANNSLSLEGAANSGRIALTTYSSSPITLNGGNVLIGTTTDAGFRLDVNGTARIQGTTTLNDVATCLQGLRVNGGYTAFNASTILGSASQSGNTFNFSTQYIGGATGTTNYFNFSGTLASGTGGSFNVFNVQQTFSNTNSSQTFRGFYYNPNITGLQAGTAHWAIHTTSGRVRFEGLPTSPTGLNAGDIYNDGGILKIV